MRITTAIAACGCAVGMAHAQVFEVEITSIGDQGVQTYSPGSLVTYSIYLDNSQGAGFGDFNGWSSFSGRVWAPGAHVIPNEGNGELSGGAWEGRRPPSTAGFPGGSGGGFRFVAQTYTPMPGGLEGSGGLGFEGLQASQPLGGFLQDTSSRLEVFRGSFIADVPGAHGIQFEATDAAYFNSAALDTTAIGIQNSMNSIWAGYAVVPTPATLLALGGLCVMRRRR